MRMARHRTAPPRRHAQQGAVAVMFALLLFALMGCTGLALDGGRLYINKAELQNAADACALAAAQQLPATGTISSTVQGYATTAGRTVATRHVRDFQSLPVRNVEVTLQYQAGLSDTQPHIARCRIAPSPMLRFWFVPFLDILGFQVTAVAYATRRAPGNNCAVPTGSCSTAASLVQ
jgi:hypothetical protein